MKIGGYLKRKNLGVPSVFDIFIITFILIFPHLRIANVQLLLLRGLLLLYGAIFCMCVALYLPERREYRSQALSLLAMWGLFNIFYHSFVPMLDKEGVDFLVAWGNWSLLNEGFLNLLCGVWLITLIVRYAKSWGWYYIPLLIYLIHYVLYVGFDISKIEVSFMGMHSGKWQMLTGDIGWSMTPIFAVLASGTITLLKKFKKWWLLIPLSIPAAIIGVYKWDYIVGVKLISRPDFWKFTLNRIWLSKFFLGHGYYHTINTKEGLVASELEGAEYIIERWGRGWRQSDFLEFGEYMGIIGMALVFWFFGNLLWRGKAGLAYFFVLTGVLMCLVQRTIYFPQKAIWILSAVSLLILETKKEAKNGQC